MRKNIDIDDSLLVKVKVLSVFENLSVKGVMEEAAAYYVKEKEDLGLLLLMQQVDTSNTVAEKEVFKLMDE